MIRKWAPWLLKGGLSIGLTWWLLAKVSLSDAWTQFQSMDPWMLALGIGLMFVQLALGALRWGVVLRVLGSKLSGFKIILLYYIGAFFATVLPGLVGGDAVRVWCTVKSGETLPVSLNSVMLERAAAVLSLAVLVAVSEPLLLERVPTLPGAWVFPALSVAGFVGVFVLTILDKVPESLRRWRAVRALSYLAADTRRVAFHSKTAAASFFSALLGNINLSLVVWALARGLDVPVGVMDCMVLVPPVFLLTTLPISVAGWGVREAAMVSALGFIGVSQSSSLVLSIVFGVLNMVTAIPGGIAFLSVGGHHIPTAAELNEDGVVQA